MRPNRFRQLLREGRPTFGTHLFTMWPTIVEVVGHTGNFDYIEFSGEYAPNGVQPARALGSSLRAVRHVVDDQARPGAAGVAVGGAIGAGFQSVLFADIRTPDEVRACVAAVRADAPGHGGIHGVADRRSALMLHAGTQRYIDALDDIVVGIMIEKASAVEALDEILAVPGIDMVQWGPADYSMSIGRPGEWNHPDVRRVERDVFERRIKAGVPPRAELNHPKDAARFLKMGVKDFCMGTDIDSSTTGCGTTARHCAASSRKSTAKRAAPRPPRTGASRRNALPARRDTAEARLPPHA